MSISFPKTEEEILKQWKDIDAFHTQLKLTENGPRFTFYDGPPFATGLPHYGHLLASTIKDIIPRYWSMKGYHVERRFGWDTHGLPIEYEIDKKLGISGRDAVMQMGIEKYNAECRAIVMTYAQEWRQTIDRLGRWIDFDNDYKTMDVSFMESCWWVFKRLFDQGDVYRAYQIMPFSTALCTPLSQMEAKSNEKETQDPSILVSFPIVGVSGYEDVSLLIYTTTPWTLPSNLLVAVHPDFEYRVLLDEATGKKYMTMESGASSLYKNPKKAKYKFLDKIQGKDMIGWKYEPLFPHFKESFSDCFRVIGADYVEEGEGTGLVHQAPAFGQEDYDAAVAAGFITPDRLPPCPVDEKGCFTDEVPEYKGMHVKAADKIILKDLRPTGRLVVESNVTHVDKFCWRSDTQLIRRAVSSWFIRVTDSIPQMLGNLEKTTWVPSVVKEKRFGNWVANAHDWNVSRNRYWGTPIPLWVSEDYEEIVCVGSIEELKQLSGYEGELTDIHRDKVDHITIPSKKGKGVLRRIDEIFDCWFESGSMPYASNHFPFKHKDNFEGQRFPADFIAEGLDQTRGWFYTLTVLGNKLFGTSPFKNCIVNGIVLAEDGKKMSKRLKNYPDPSHVLNSYGSDALRLYLINSPVVRAESIRFKEAGVKDIVTRVLLPMWNSYRFFSEQAALYKKTNDCDFVAHLTIRPEEITNVMDRWILADCQSLLRFMEKEMKGYRLYTVVPRLLSMIDNLTNWYIRFNRKRLKGSQGLEDSNAALNTLYQVLFTMVRAMAPFTPFLTDHIYSLLKAFLGDKDLGKFADSRSVHFIGIPDVQEALFDEDIERKVSAMQTVIQLARTSRERCNLPLKTPLATLVVIADEAVLEDVKSLSSYIEEELNIREVILTTKAEEYNVILEAKVDWPTLGKKLKKNVQVVRKGLPALTQDQLKAYQKEGKINVGGIDLNGNDLVIVRVMAKPDSAAAAAAIPSQWEPGFAEDMVVLIDRTVRAELAEEGMARDIISRIQKLRKKAGLMSTDDVRMEYRVLKNPENVDLVAVTENQSATFITTLRGKLVAQEEGDSREVIAEEEQAMGELSVMLRLTKL